MSGADHPAEARLRRFSRLTWGAGIAAVAIVGIVLMPGIGVDPGSGRVFVVDRGWTGEAEYDRPWLHDDPVELELVDGVIAGGAEGGYFTLKPGSKPLRLTAESIENVTPQYGGSWVTVYQGRDDFFADLPGDDESGTGEQADPWERADGIAQVGPLEDDDDSVLYVVPTDERTQVWFTGELGDWSIRAEEVDATPLDGSVTGSGNAVLEYRGEGLSAKLEHTGTGILNVRMFVPGERSLDPVVGADDFVQRVSWDAPGSVLFVIESDTGEGEWTATVNE
ncbi:hypothetical protein NHL51_11715 [Leucobacter sp. gxy201]|uniref:hypothetical protein n=1 Tax=Leucobacter sp. gxy201 TaxID=2957200 RepID=UPI003DA110FC